MAGNVNADQFHASLSLRLFNTEFMKTVEMRNAKVDSNLALDGAAFTGSLNASGLLVGGSLFMRSSRLHKATFKDVNLRRAAITVSLETDGASFEGDLTLKSAKINVNLDMERTYFGGKLDVELIQVGGSVSMNEVVATQSMKMQFARIGGNLDLRRAILADLDLSGASVAGELRLGQAEDLKTPAFWHPRDKKPGDLFLRHARVGSLMDTQNAWPVIGHLHLDGFAFSRLGGFEGDSGRKMRERRMIWWDGWARRDPAYSPGLYEQLAATLVASGDRALADEIRYLGRVRERETETNCGVWILFRVSSVCCRLWHRQLHVPGPVLGDRHFACWRPLPLATGPGGPCAWLRLVLWCQLRVGCCR